MTTRVRHLTEEELRRALQENKLPKDQLDIEMRYHHIAATVPYTLIKSQKYRMKYSLSNLGFQTIEQNYTKLRMIQIILGLGGSSVASENEDIQKLIKLSLVIKLMVMTLDMDKRDPLVQLMLPNLDNKQLPDQNESRFREKWKMITCILSQFVQLPSEMPPISSQQWLHLVTGIVLDSTGLHLRQFQGKYHFERGSCWERMQLDIYKYISFSLNMFNLSENLEEQYQGVCGVCAKVGCVKQGRCCRCTATPAHTGHRDIYQPIDTHCPDIFTLKVDLPWEKKQMDFSAVDRILECLGFDGGHQSESKMVKTKIAKLWKTAVVSVDDVSLIKKMFRVDLMGAVKNRKDISLVGAKLKILLKVKGLKFSKRKCGKCLRYYQIVPNKAKRTN